MANLSIQMDDGGEWGSGARADLRSERGIKLQFAGVGAHPWVLERQNGLARGVYNRLVAGDRPSGKQFSAEAQWRPTAPISGGGSSAY